MPSVAFDSPEVQRSATRPEIQALRAVAVVAVLLYHLWPDRIRGGFVGVDVFFVISGYLITAHLLREALISGRVSLTRFWARRARRLLPASLLVLTACAVGVWFLAPRHQWQQFFSEILASTTYVQNWLLALNAVDYLGADNAPSPVQHFWSLSAEEQFYLIWPVLLFAAVLLAGRRSSAVRRRWFIGGVLTAVGACSLVFSVVLTAQTPAAAYFVTTTRAWEFAAGGLLAVAGSMAGGLILRSIVAWAGWLAIVATALLYTSSISFPGYAAAVPVSGALAVLWAGSPSTSWSPNAVVLFRPVQFLGNISYALYLWHWPLIVLAPHVLGPLTWQSRFGILALSVLLAWGTKVWVEDPARSRSVLVRLRPRWTFIAAAGAMAVVVATASAGLVVLRQEKDAVQAKVQEAIESAGPCFGAGALVAGPTCATSPTPYDRIVPNPDVAAEDYRRCIIVNSESAVKDECTYRSTNPHDVWALIGDSHADAIAPAIEIIAEAQNATLHVITKGQCPLIDGWRGDDGSRRLDSEIAHTCTAWNDAVLVYLAEHPEISQIFVTGSAHNVYQPESVSGWFDADVVAYRSAWAAVPDSVDSIVVIRDMPRQTQEVPSCVSAHPDDYIVACSGTRDQSLLDDPMKVAAITTDDKRVSLVDVSDLLCTKALCPVVIGGVLVYMDNQHLTATFARSLAPFIAKQMRAS